MAPNHSARLAGLSSPDQSGRLLSIRRSCNCRSQFRPEMIYHRVGHDQPQAISKICNFNNSNAYWMFSNHCVANQLWTGITSALTGPLRC